MFGPIIKLLLLIAVTVILVPWPIIGIMGSILAGLAYGFLAPAMATFDAVGEGKEKLLLHCFLVQLTCIGVTLILASFLFYLFNMVR